MNDKSITPALVELRGLDVSIPRKVGAPGAGSEIGVVK